MKRRLLVWASLVLLFGVWLLSDTLFPPETINAAQAKVRDGDTLTLNERNIRLYGIDAPEYRQNCALANGKDWPCGAEARLMMVALVGRAAITCQPRATDRYGRIVASCSTPTTADLGLAMVEAGLAINSDQRGDGPYEVSEARASLAKRGIWQGTFTRPDDWRKEHPRQSTPIPLNKDTAS